jgi:hypothetical protein
VCVCVCARARARVWLFKKKYINTYEHMYVYMLTYADVC